MWFKDFQTVLVYHPGSGGEYICSKLNGQKELYDKNNKHRCFNSFPGSGHLYETVSSREPTDWEWSEECRLTFKDEKELQSFVTKEEKWYFKSGNPDRLSPRLGQKSLMENCNHFPTHWCYGLFREPVYKWLDCDNDYWLVHWDIMLDIKDLYVENNVEQSKGKWNRYDKAEKDPRSFLQRYNRYRDYYKTRFPKSRVSIESLVSKTNYKQWAENNLSLSKAILDKHNISSAVLDKVFSEFPL